MNYMDHTRVTDKEKQLLGYLKDHPWASPMAISAGLGHFHPGLCEKCKIGDSNWASPTLRRLHKAGMLVERGRAEYKLSSSGLKFLAEINQHSGKTMISQEVRA